MLQNLQFNVLLGMIRVRVYNLWSRVVSVGKRGVGWNIICKLLENKYLVRDVWGKGGKDPIETVLN